MTPPAASAPPSTFVLVHGHDDDPAAFVAAAQAMAPDGARTIVPTGLVSVGTRRSWWESDVNGDPDPRQVRAAIDAIDAVVASAPGDEPLTLAGFSQGAALALLWALRVVDPDAPPPRSVDALVLLAGWLPTVEGIDLQPASTRARRALVAHGADDEVVPLVMGRSAHRVLQRHDVDVTFVELEGGHALVSFVEPVRTWLTGGPHSRSA